MEENELIIEHSLQFTISSLISDSTKCTGKKYVSHYIVRFIKL